MHAGKLLSLGVTCLRCARFCGSIVSYYSITIYVLLGANKMFERVGKWLLDDLSRFLLSQKFLKEIVVANFFLLEDSLQRENGLLKFLNVNFFALRSFVQPLMNTRSVAPLGFLEPDAGGSSGVLIGALGSLTNPRSHLVALVLLMVVELGFLTH